MPWELNSFTTETQSHREQPTMISLYLCDSVLKTGRQLFVKVPYLLRF